MTVDRIFLYGVAGLVSGALCIGLALLKRRRLPDLGQVASCFLAGPGLVGAFWLGREGLVPSTALRAVPEISDLRVYLILGGVALGWVSLLAIAKECRSAMAPTAAARRDDPPPGDDPPNRP